METRHRKRCKSQSSTLGFSDIVSNLKSQALAGVEHKPASTKHAAVLVPLFEDVAGVTQVLLTLRSTALASHAGEVCLPGGKRDPSDPSDEFTAKREAHEEVGLEAHDAEVLCQLPPLLSKHFLSVTPVVAKVPSTFVAQPNPSEVAAVFSVPLFTFLSPLDGVHSSRLLQWQDHAYRIHYFEHEGFTIWGLTAAILIQVAKVAYASPTSYAEHGGGIDYTRLRCEDGTLLLSPI